MQKLQKQVNNIVKAENGFIVNTWVPEEIDCKHPHYNHHNHYPGPQYFNKTEQHVFNDFQAMSDFLKEFYGK